MKTTTPSNPVRRVRATATLRRSFATALLALLVIDAVPPPARAQSAVPPYFSYQGKVSNSAGVLIGAGSPVNRKVTFKVWQSASSPADSDLVYAEFQILSILDGEFSALVGLGLPLPGYESKGPGVQNLALAFSGSNRFVGITVDDGDNNPANDVEIAPRQQMVSTGYAFRARYAEGLASNGNGGTYDVGGVLNLFDGGGKSRPGGIAPEYGGGLLNFGTNDVRFGPPTWTDQGGFLRTDFRTNEPLFNFLGRPAGSTSQAVPLMAIHANGNVGIGTQTPTERLHVEGTFRLDGAFNQGPGREFTLDNPGVSGGRFRVTSAGNVGIGVAAPTRRLEVAGDTKVTGNLEVTGNLSYAALAVAIKADGGQGFSFSGSGDQDGGLFSPADGNVIVRTDGQERLRVDNANVFLGFPHGGGTRDMTLKVNGWVQSKGFSFVEGDTNGGMFSLGAGILTLNSAGEERIRITGDQSVRIGRGANHGGNLGVTLGLRGKLHLFSSSNVVRPAGVGVEQDGGEDKLINFGINMNQIGGVVQSDAGGIFRVDARANQNLFQWLSRSSGATNESLAMTLSEAGDLVTNRKIAARGSSGFVFHSDGDTDSGMFSTADNSVEFRTNGQEQVRFSGGNVGIGTTGPTSKLHVVGEILGSSIVSVTSVTAGGFRLNGDVGMFSDNGSIYFRSGGVNPFWIKNTGNVGIGTNDPAVPLEVGSSVQQTYLEEFYVSASTTGDNPSPGHSRTNPVSLKTAGYILAPTLHIYSDERIKHAIRKSHGAEDLSILQRIEITDFSYLDTLVHGRGHQKKVIAQQVEKVFPLAVRKSTDVVPDIFLPANITDGWVQLTTNLKVGDRVQLIAGKVKEIYEVLEVQADRFRTAFRPAEGKIFVYGREVADFRTVDYEAIAMLNVSATQEIKREKDAEVKALREQNAALTAEIASLRSEFTALAAQEKARDAKLASIEKLLQSAQTVMARPAGAPRANANGQE